MSRPSPLRPIAAKLALVAVLFAAVPAVVYQQFRVADEERTALLLDGVANQGRAIAEALRPILETGDPTAVTKVGDRMAALAGAQVELRLLFRPQEAAIDSFLLVAAVPPVQADSMQAERAFLIQSRLLETAWRSCDATEAIGRSVDGDSYDTRGVVAVTPVQSAAGCWALVTRLTASEALARTVSTPYWQRPEIVLALGLYLALAVVILLILFSVSRNLARFERLARSISMGREGDRRFAKLNEVPELTGVAQQFDAMVDRLRLSAASIRETAEESAHALKTPIGAIRQSLEPLRAVIPADDRRGRRAIEIIDQCCARLGQLVVEARRAIETAALMADPPNQVLDLGRVVSGLVEEMRGPSEAADVHLEAHVDPGVTVLGGDEAIETIVENLIDNAIGFSPPGGTVRVMVRAERRGAVLSVLDQGPGVAPDRVDRIFEKGYTSRPSPVAGAEPAVEENFGMGLWIVRRNVEAMNGTIRVENRATGGLGVEIVLPLAGPA
ncbi:HAMP domain-containing sensor histidine kinase [Thalassobaculum sp.]|uniref:sensor histidine kinase n=1 Tax=Thalassobaculum sp. TaxID=2022740 RepID=UPI0032EB38FB